MNRHYRKVTKSDLECEGPAFALFLSACRQKRKAGPAGFYESEGRAFALQKAALKEVEIHETFSY